MNENLITESNTLWDAIKPFIFRDKETPKSNVHLLKSTPGTVKRPSMTYHQPSNTMYSDYGYYPSEYPLADIGAAEDTDSYVYQAIIKKLALAMKEGHAFVGKNQDTIKYIKERISQLEVAQDQTFRSLLMEMMGTLLRYHALFLIKKRDIDASGGRVRRVNGKPIKPVAGYFVASPDTMQIKIGKDYKIKGYKHTMPDGRYKVFKPDDVIYIHINKKPHFLSPTPPWHPVIEDVVALRKIEEHIENLIYQHIYPLFQYKVGTETAPMQRYSDGSTEVDRIKAQVQRMPSDGMIVTPERHEIKGLGSESKALRVETHVEHFKNRVITGTGMSQLDFGDGNTSNRSTADSMSKLATGNVKFYQQCLADAINFYIIRELLLESTFQFNVFSEENKVEIRFAEIDHEAQIKLQNHYMLLFQGEMLTRTEARNLSGWEAMKEEDEQDSRLHKIGMTELEKQGEIELKKTEAQGKAQAAQRAAQNKQQPKNQHGKASGPTKKKSSREKDGAAAMVYDQLMGDVKNIGNNVNLSLVRQLFFIAESQIKRSFRNEIDQAAIRGASEFVLTGSLLEKIRNTADRVYRDFEKDVERLVRDAMVKTSTELATGMRDNLSIERLEYRIRFIEETLTHKAFILAKVAAMRENNITRAQVKSEPNGEDYFVWNNVVIDLETVTPEDLPPFHPNCKCNLVPLGDVNA